MRVIETDGEVVKAWVDGVEFEEEAEKQVRNVASLPFIHKHVAIEKEEDALPLPRPECSYHWNCGPWIGPLRKCESCGQMVPDGNFGRRSWEGE